MSDNKDVPELKTADELAGELKGEPSADDEVSKTHTFEIDYQGPRGQRYPGAFETQALTIRQKRAVKTIKAQLAGGVPVSALDADAWELNEMLAWLSIALTKRPKWARDLESHYDENVIRAIYKEVLDHEDRFHGRGLDQDVGEEPSE